ncbi:MAG: hypothetical protein OXB90_10200, partial [Acidimicrobiaceae bacterium]|nr:hypothetical protein [Acidimicrobiaceae bacterium]
DGAVVQIGTPEEILTQPATGYVAEFVQDVDQGRVIQVHEIMQPPAPLSLDTALADALTRTTERSGAFILDAFGVPTHLFTIEDGARASSMGTTELVSALRTDFERCKPEDRLNSVYAAAGRGLPIAVCDDAGVLVGNLDPRHIMEEMGRVENLIEDFEKEVFM